MKELVLTASVELLDDVLNFIDTQLAEAQCPAEARTLIAIACEEIYVNIANYAYSQDGGTVSILCEAEQTQVTISFSDCGVPYNPLSRQTPDITMDAESRPVGGLGIFMAKDIMDSVSYQYSNGKNVLTVLKRFK